MLSAQIGIHPHLWLRVVSDAISALTALAQENRLDVFRLLPPPKKSITTSPKTKKSLPVDFDSKFNKKDFRSSN